MDARTMKHWLRVLGEVLVELTTEPKDAQEPEPGDTEAALYNALQTAVTRMRECMAQTGYHFHLDDLTPLLQEPEPAKTMSDVVREVARERGMPVHEITVAHVDPADYKGMPKTPEPEQRAQAEERADRATTVPRDVQQLVSQLLDHIDDDGSSGARLRRADAVRIAAKYGLPADWDLSGDTTPPAPVPPLTDFERDTLRMVSKHPGGITLTALMRHSTAKGTTQQTVYALWDRRYLVRWPGDERTEPTYTISTQGALVLDPPTVTTPEQAVEILRSALRIAETRLDQIQTYRHVKSESELQKIRDVLRETAS